MRILYGVHGYGRGHATRALALLPYLARRHQMLVVAGGDAYSAIWPEFPVARVPTFSFAYGPGTGRRSNWHTLRRNVAAVLDLLLRGPIFEMVRDMVREFAPDVIISDAEPWTHHVAAALRIPRISLDHVGILRHGRLPIPWGDRWAAGLDGFCYRTLVGRPERVIVSSFYEVPIRDPNVRLVGTLPRPAVRDLKPWRGEHLLVYFNRGHEQLGPVQLAALQDVGCPAHIYGTERQGRQGRLTFFPPSNLPFLEDLASCRAVLSTAGNQLVGEAIYLGKPVLVVPEHSVEQRLNAAAVERLQIGMRLRPREFTAERIRLFLSRMDCYTAQLQRHARDGLSETLTLLVQFLTELASAAAIPLPSRERADRSLPANLTLPETGAPP
jgi:uncharacterized protein (TIGR00661 family)